jgi:hypothetical protein
MRGILSVCRRLALKKLIEAGTEAKIFSMSFPTIANLVST